MDVETAYFVELFDENHHLLGRLETGTPTRTRGSAGFTC